MSKIELQKKIKKEEGYILSDGTHDLETLLSKAYDVLVDFKIRSKEISNEIAEVIGYNGGCTRASLSSYYGLLEITNIEKASYTWNESVFEFFNGLSPNGYSFGSSEGDGACMGWFKNETY